MNEPGMVRWDFEKDALCFNCHKSAMQLIEIYPIETMVTCVNCFKERHYTVHRVYVADDREPFEDEDFRQRHDVWSFGITDRCLNCGNCVDNEVDVDEFRVRTICPICYYTRVYEFNMFAEGHAHR